MVTRAGEMSSQQEHNLETRAPRSQNDPDINIVDIEPGRGIPAPSQRSAASVPQREVSSDPSNRSLIPTEKLRKSQAKPSRPPPRRRVAILVMGGTGTGKSSFIAEVTGQRVQVGHSLHSCTAECASYECRLDDRNTVMLVDTPGFNDTNRLDLDILKCITTYLMDLQEEGIQLVGMIYMQRITDRRMTGASFLNLKMFQAFCGKDYFPQVMLVTTMWNQIRDNRAAQQELLSRERELAKTPEFWGDMIDRGANVRQFRGDKTSGLDIIHFLYQQEQVRRPLIMTEFNEGFILPNTGAGKVLVEEIIRREKKREKEEREEREEIEAERLRRRQLEELEFTRSQRPQTTVQPQMLPPPRRSQTDGVERSHPDAVQASKAAYHRSS